MITTLKHLPSRVPAPLDRPEPRRPRECPVEDWLTFLGHRWSALVLWHLKDGPRRHGELAALLPRVTPKVLAERLEAMAARGLVRREEARGFPRAVRYALTPAGAELTAVLDGLEIWAKRRSSANHDAGDHGPNRSADP